MRVLQSTVEKLLYLLLVVTTVVNISLGIFLYITSRNINNQTDQIEEYVHCIVSVFAQPNRTNIVVTNIDKCSLVRK